MNFTNFTTFTPSMVTRNQDCNGHGTVTNRSQRGATITTFNSRNFLQTVSSDDYAQERTGRLCGTGVLIPPSSKHLNEFEHLTMFNVMKYPMPQNSGLRFENSNIVHSLENLQPWIRCSRFSMNVDVDTEKGCQAHYQVHRCARACHLTSARVASVFDKSFIIQNANNVELRQIHEVLRTEVGAVVFPHSRVDSLGIVTSCNVLKRRLHSMNKQ